jgi:hypothetical protein
MAPKKLSARALSQHWQPRSGVEDDAGRGVAGSQGIGESVGGQFGAHVIGHGVAGDLAGGDKAHANVPRANNITRRPGPAFYRTGVTVTRRRSPPDPPTTERSQRKEPD